MDIKVVTNIKTNKKTYFINGRRVSVNEYYKLNLRTYNSSFQYRTKERIYSLFSL